MPNINRRQLLGAGLAAGAWPLAAHTQNVSGDGPTFGLGVASGCPRPGSVVLWTRLVFPEAEVDPFSFAAPGTTAREPLEVEWEIATDDRFADAVQTGTERAVPGLAHSVHVQVSGLDPATTYFYRFRCAGAESETGRTKTAPAADAGGPVSFAFASCQHYEQGYYAALRDIAGRDLDFVLHLGDYIYEASYGVGNVRRHDGGIPTTLGEFRKRYRLYKSDPDLQAAHAAFPWLVIWDDHEVRNDYFGTGAPGATHEEHFRARRAAAYQAWFEHMPVPPHLAPDFANLTIYDSYTFGKTLELVLLDARQYRSAVADSVAEAGNPDRTMLGEEQEAWLETALAESDARWTVVAQPTLLSERDMEPGEAVSYSLDGWDGYRAARQRLLDMVREASLPNTVVLGGDLHAFYAADVPARFETTDAPPLATEFTVGSVTSYGPSRQAILTALAENPHLQFAEGSAHGYAIARVRAEAVDVAFIAMSDKRDPDATASALASFTVRDGTPKVVLPEAT